jgi:prepilin-type N-terminal cleavage/methylation domain-containing protein
MKFFIKNNLLVYIKKYPKNQGFTLIEVLIVTIIVGILSAISIPNLLEQIGKARETTAKNGVSILIRAEQAYHFEKGFFIDGGGDIRNVSKILGVTLPESKYYSFSVYNVTYSPQPTITGTVVSAFYQNGDDPSIGKDYGIRKYKGGLYHKQGIYDSAICRANTIANAPYSPYFNPNWDNTNNQVYCDSGGTEIK